VGRPSWRPPLPINTEDLAVLQVLEDGQTHNRVDVAATLHTSVRQVRRSVSELRRLGWPIGYGEDRGYRLSWEPTNLDRLERKYHAQALSQLKTLSRIKRARRAAATALFDEPSIDELRQEKIETDVMLDETWPA
jgi:biotin operon repressor